MDRLFKCLLLAAISLSMAACVNAAAEPDVATIKAAAQKRFAGREVDTVRTTPMKGVYEVIIKPHQIVYTDAKVSYMIVGEMVDLDAHVSLTEARMQQLMHTDFKKLPFDQAIKIVHGDGSRKVAIFSDPDCPFCKKIERETLKDLDNVTMYVFLYPLAQLHPDAGRKASLIWCADDKQAAWQAWMFDSKLPNNDGKCATPMSAIANVADSLDIRGTPAMVFESGEISAGAISKPEFEAKLVSKAAQ